ncbi:MAG: tRNA (N6-isopentenyl adenosine(37)-C2)-methylthiotransferase MiaB [Thermodesulfobacteriota bacterium]|nr:tRNA (N6-isopentenyl adenosine(37)-C2)-methylthiotransferase MiaB [Thermodesulfobacteriota bacterium]
MNGYVKIFTYGCQMNDLDTQKMYSLLFKKGWHPTTKTVEADIIILNTCSVRKKAYEKALSNLGRLKKYKEKKPSLIIAVAGCVAQQEGDSIIKRLPYVDIVLGTHQLHKLANIVDDTLRYKKSVVDTVFDHYIPSMDIIPLKRFLTPSHKAYINIMQGCNNFCSYCIVPYVRGREISRDYKQVLDEIENLSKNGVKEVFLLGQNVNSYRGGITFPELLERIHDIKEVERIRFTTSHPKDVTDELIECFGKLDKLCNHIHLPFQSGSDNVLKAMNRGYTRQDYIGLIEKLKASRKNTAFSADVIVGFPTETDKDFALTMDLINTVRFDLLYSFKYSPRPGTKASNMTDTVPIAEKARRLSILQDAQRQITLSNNQARVGNVYDVIVDGISKRDPNAVSGRTTQNTIVNFKGSHELIGTTVSVKIEKANPNSLTGKLY